MQNSTAPSDPKMSRSYNTPSCLLCRSYYTTVYHYSLKYIFVLIMSDNLKSHTELTVWINHGNKRFNSSIQPAPPRPAALSSLTAVVEAYACVTGGGGQVSMENFYKRDTISALRRVQWLKRSIVLNMNGTPLSKAVWVGRPCCRLATWLSRWHGGAVKVNKGRLLSLPAPGHMATASQRPARMISPAR